MTNNVWQSYTFTVQVAAAGTSDVQMLSYDANLSRVRVDLTVARDGTEPAGSTWTVQRSTDLVRWTTVRGGDGIPVSATALTLDDYEFAASQQNHYRAQVWSAGSLVHTYADAITPLLTRVWWKDLARPFLNRPVTVQDFSDVTRASRNGTFDIVGSSVPVVVTDVLSARKYTLTLLVDGLAEAAEFEQLLALAGVVFLHTPADSPVPGGYYATGDVAISRPGRLSTRRLFALPLTQAAAPAASVVGGTTTWAAVMAKYATWADLLADPAVTSWRDLIDQVAGIGEVIDA